MTSTECCEVCGYWHDVLNEPCLRTPGRASGRPAKIVSFGFKYGMPADPARHTVIDVRGAFRRNPHRIPALRARNGLDPAVGADILKTLEFNYKWARLQERIIEAVKGGVTVVYLGCTGGRHRSVYLADRLGRDWQVPVEHRDLNKGG